MKKKKSVWFMMVAILMGFIPPILTACSSIAHAIEIQPDKIVDQAGLKVISSVSSDGNSLNWELQYEKSVASDGNDQALKFKVTADGEAIAFNEDASFAANDDQWFAEKNFSKQSQGSLSFTTALNVSKVALEIQADATKTDGTQAVTINKNILTSAVEGPHALKLPAVATQETTEVSATSPTTAEETTSSQETETTAQTEEASEAKSSEINSSRVVVGASNLKYLSGISAFSSINYSNIAPEYTTDATKGTFPTNSWQPAGQTNVINHQGNKERNFATWDGVTSWNGDPSDTTHSYIQYGEKQTDFAIRKYAKETSKPGLYDVYLNVKGNKQEDIKPVDIVLVVDMSGSMESSQSNGWNDRAGAARNGVKNFLQTIKDAGIGDYVNVGLVGFSSPGYVTGPNGYLTVPIGKASDTSHINAINDALKPKFTGGTYTQIGIEQGQQMLAGSSNENKMMIVLTDGVPTFSKKVTAAQTIDGTTYATEFGNRLDEPGDTSKLNRSYAVGSWGNRTNIDSTWPATLGAAKIAKDAGLTIHLLGIQLSKDRNFLTEQQVRDRASLIATPGKYKDAETTDDVSDYLNEQAKNVVKSFNTIVNGSINDPLGDQFSYEGTPTVKSISTGDSAVTNLPTVNQSNGKVTTTELNLGKDQEIQIHYQVRINTEDKDFTPEKWYPMNGQTTLTPNGDNPDNKVDFGVPSAKAPGVKLDLKKIWEEYDKDTSKRPDSLNFTLNRKDTTESNSWKQGFIRLSKSDVATDTNVWEKTNIEKVAETQGATESLWLPQFNNKGKDFAYSFEEATVNGYESSSNAATTIWTNKKIYTPLALEITKISDQGKTPLKGAVFKLSGGSLPNAGVELKDNGDGTYTLSDDKYKLQLNTEYTLTEVTPPAGHTATTTSWKVNVSAEGKVTINDAVTGIEIKDNTIKYTIENEFTKRPLLVEKYNKDSGKTLDGAKFTLKQYDDKWTNDGKVVGDDLIGNDAKSFASLAPGYYSLEETKVPTGYKKDDTVFKFQIDSAGKLLDANGKEITANSKPTTDGFYLTSDNKIVLIKYNELRDFDFSILKKNSQSNKPLADTEFSLATKEDSNTILATLKTNDEGTGQFLDASGNHYGVRPGTYVIKETKAPEGFVLLKGIFEVTINADGTVGDVTYDGKDLDKDAIKVNLKDEDNNVIELTVANTPKGQLPATGGSGIQTFIIVALALVTAAGALTICYFYRNRKELN
ncbi:MULTISPECIES: SpaA isopeptide-forming pilin-related protein [Enterococcus]|uniref:SpaA isopeptide-forming pilin-related protein n=1 Tax=Enterococcus TaxID=1350 RepID=UPI001899CE05|nr:MULTISPECIES: SpaA isopeptide-forming pilin-related protein [Enterococcus]MDB7367408.1 SpaA isopeptide-forming pilin-related protein [Enterococcus faecium]MDB7521255.1 SpaA isopeptide-forming pilin-related protein [Enterococcus faecium]MDB7523932.1 SpaA isopeptide-forming pilin-related protein [Enterococcus faecium]MDB7526567.1 SpaA isopeptide-forming pilin-related protein [Enterococcus faecium]MDB7529204.1 SpaA isopeptide-forming pilin-related protein [Enterococcus faecium]